MSGALDSLLQRVGDLDLRAQIRAEFDRSTKALGLTFARDEREGVPAPGAPVVVGGKVLLDARGTLHKVTSVNAETVTVACTDATERTVPVNEVTAARELGDTIYPGLVPVDEIRSGDPSAPVHTVISGEVFHALQLLQYTHEGKVDLIYVDPPYNTGSRTWKYNGRYVSESDSYRHSKWLSFMEKRLRLAKTLLKPTGVILVAIDDNEHHRLRMLMDEVFGAQNFLANVTWQGIIRNDSYLLGNGVDYMVAYARDKAAVKASNRPWREPKQGLTEIAEAGQVAWEESGGDSTLATALLRQWWKSLPDTHPSKVGGDATTSFKHVDGDTRPGHVYAYGALASPGGQGPRYEVFHPITGRPCRIPKSGWLYSEATMAAEIAAGNIRFGEDETTLPQKKRFLEDSGSTTVAPTFYASRRGGAAHLAGILGHRHFAYARNHDVMMRWIRMIAPSDAVVLDFFGDPGTTVEAVIRLNQEDGGTRQAILLTDNVVPEDESKKLRAQGLGQGHDAYEAQGAFRRIIIPRLRTVITGQRADGSSYSAGLPANAAFFDLTYLDRARVKYGHELDALASVFWLRAGGLGPLLRRGTAGQACAVDPDSKVAFLFRPGRASQLAAAVAQGKYPHLRHVFVDTPSIERANTAASYLNPRVTVERVYDGYLSAFENTRKD